LKAPLIQSLPTEIGKILNSWDGRCDTNSIAATIFYAFKISLPKVLGQLLNSRISYRPQDVHLYHLLAKNKKLPVTKGSITKEALIVTTWDSTQVELIKQLGNDVNQWQFGKYHRFVINHIAKLAPFSLPAVPANGNNRTVNVSSKMPASHGASMRTVISLSPTGPKAWMLVSGGQSGRINSQNYSDQVKDYHSVNYHEIRYPDSFNPKVYASTIQFK
jgi:acyl-homoserine lactone acylase PvdQ